MCIRDRKLDILYSMKFRHIVHEVVNVHFDTHYTPYYILLNISLMPDFAHCCILSSVAQYCLQLLTAACCCIQLPAAYSCLLHVVHAPSFVHHCLLLHCHLLLLTVAAYNVAHCCMLNVAYSRSQIPAVAYCCLLLLSDTCCCCCCLL